MTVSTVEDFWGVFNHIERVSKLQSGFDFSFFKRGIKPMWEDNANRQGGKWVVNYDRKQRIGGNTEVSKIIGQFSKSNKLCLILWAIG